MPVASFNFATMLSPTALTPRLTEGSCPGGFSFFCKCMLHKTHSRRLRAALPSAFAAFELSGATFSMLAANNKIQPRPKITPPHTGTKTRCVTVPRCGLNLLWFRKHRSDLRTISILLENPVNSENCSNFRAPHCCTQYQAKPYVSTFLVHFYCLGHLGAPNTKSAGGSSTQKGL
jgi:hypothetical protein